MRSAGDTKMIRREGYGRTRRYWKWNISLGSPSLRKGDFGYILIQAGQSPTQSTTRQPPCSSLVGFVVVLGTQDPTAPCSCGDVSLAVYVHGGRLYASVFPEARCSAPGLDFHCLVPTQHLA